MALTDEAIERIKYMIISGDLLAGERLPKEEVLAAQLGLSRSSLREAVRALTAMKILVARQGDGTYVSSLEPHLLLESLSFAADVSQGQDALHLLQVRRMLEPQAAAIAATVVTDEQLSDLRSILERGAQESEPDTFVRLDHEFHRAVVEIAGNPVLCVLLEVLSTQTQRLRVLRGTTVASAIKEAQREHEAILAALAARDAQLASAAVAVHVAAVERWIASGMVLGEGGV